jgi:OOP family OmpA-OmpF porin
MNQRLLSFFLLLLFVVSGKSQSKSDYFDLLSYHISLSDYSNASSKISTPNPWYRIQGKSFGAGVNAWKHLKPQLDLSGGLNFTFSNFPAGFVRGDSIGQGKISTQLDFLAHVYATSDKKRLRPFLSAGLGIGIFPQQTALYIPAGAGLQYTFYEGARLLLQAQMRQRLTSGITANYLLYSLGIAQTVSSPKRRKQIMIPPPTYTKVDTIMNDRDEDGFSDDEDACPDIKGSLMGCPDRDKDQIPDMTDVCPDESGNLNGCPDKDGDLIPDYKDDCPEEAGTINGCPDNDGDQIINKLDACPDVSGLPKYNGCPIPDTDNDGINDEEDACLQIAGTAENKGCPEIKKDVQQQINYTAKNILFLFGSAKLLPSSYVSLNNLVKVLQANSSYKLKIEAHTDNIGYPAKNLLLSIQRAKSVAAYLIYKGIPANRLTTKGFGAAVPIANNKTETGRAINRRVELKISFD